MDQELMAMKMAAILYSSPFRYLVSCLSLIDESAAERLAKQIDESIIREVLGNDILRPDTEPQDKVSLYIVARFVHDLLNKDLSEKIKKALKENLLVKENYLKLISGSIDITGFIAKDSVSKVSKVIFKHPVDLSEIDLTEELGVFMNKDNKFRESIDIFCKKLIDAASKAKGMEYHALWRVIPSAFVTSVKEVYERDLSNELISKLTLIPADPRSPHITALDHMYSILPFMLSDTQIGIISWEICNKQGFISTSKIPRDLWAGSYLISLLTFYVLKSLSDEIGPDSVIKPSLYSSSLYDAYLGSIFGEITEEEFLEEILTPSIPGAGIILVPGYKVEYFARRIKELYKEIWNIITEQFKEQLDRDLRDIDESAKGKIISMKLDLIDKQKEEMPFDIAIAYLKVPIDDKEREELLKELLESGALSEKEISEIKRIKELGKDTKGVQSLILCWSIFIKALSSIHYSFTRTRVDDRVLEAPIRIEKKEDLCNVCWKREAIIGVKRLENLEKKEDREELRKLLGKLHDKEGIIIRDGERLCFHCLIRRCLRNSIDKILDRSMGIKIEYKEKAYPSTETIAGAPFAYTLLSLLASPDKLDKDRLSKWMDDLGELKGIFSKIYGLSKARLVKSSSYEILYNKAPKEVANMLDKYLTAFYREHYIRAERFAELGEDAKRALDLLECTMKEAPTSIFMSLRDSPLAWLEIEKVLPEGTDRIIRSLCIVRSLSDYFAIVKSDGDSMRDLLEGSGIHQKKLMDMIPLSILKGDTPSIKGEDLLTRWIPSISYGLMISRALTILSTKTAKQIEEKGGLVVYSGGDDVLTMIPAEISIQTVLSTRKTFSRSVIEVKDRFAEKVLREKNVIYQFPGLGKRATQSSSILLVDAFFPLRKSIEMVSNFVEEKAKAVRYPSGEKDCLHIVYRGREGYIPMSLIEIEKLKELLLTLALGSSIRSGSWGFLILNGHVKPVRGFSRDVVEVKTDLNSEECYNLYESSARRAGVDAELLRQLAPLREISVITPRGRSCLLSEILNGVAALLGAFRESRPLVLGEEV
jgi:CRISPR-associated protein Cas10/Cmr2 subtype III-B